MILTLMPNDNLQFKNLQKRYNDIRINLEFNDYSDIDSFFEQNNIASDEDYTQMLQAGIQRPRVLKKTTERKMA
jgi:hypothetical protein